MTEFAELSPPEADGLWLRPGSVLPAVPRWGHVDGIQIGLHPIQGPRGLLRVFAPYLGIPHRDKLLNFVAIEPIPSGQTERGFSELEHSELDGAQGKRFWSADSLDDTRPMASDRPARGTITARDGVERLAVFVISERFDNGAHVAVEVTFRADRPHEVSLAATALPGSAELEYCILTATMGNYPRLRRVRLAESTVTPQSLWPDFDGKHFTEHAVFGLDQLPRNAKGEVVVTATPDEADPGAASYAPGVAEHWKYVGRRASQTWTVADPDPSLALLVNARAEYWASTAPIPGGASFENFELREHFRNGREFRLTIEPLD
ncbi:MAG: hypothetical protein KF739_02440 [Cryobacterium sp.]|nr:hypothetical protein [Cryobacterium sp.]